MENLFAILIGALAGAGIGYYLGFKHCSEHIINDLTAMVMENITDLNHEIVDTQHYLYYKDNGEFAAQGTSLDDAAKNFSIRDKSVGRVMTSLGTAFFIIDGKIETE